MATNETTIQIGDRYKSYVTGSVYRVVDITETHATLMCERAGTFAPVGDTFTFHLPLLDGMRKLTATP